MLSSDNEVEVSADGAVSIMRTLLKGRPDLRDDFYSNLQSFFCQAGVDIPRSAFSGIVPALANELLSERAHVVAFRD